MGKPNHMARNLEIFFYTNKNIGTPASNAVTSSIFRPYSQPEYFQKQCLHNFQKTEKQNGPKGFLKVSFFSPEQSFMLMDAQMGNMMPVISTEINLN